ncbi:MAG: DUF1294 domain-containing protein [Clostridiales bacterium]|nr:DUF1294 domain-containing protein [Clostridiales bacterium]
MTAVGFLAMALDKRRAVRGGWRIPERTLFLIAALGGALGVWLGMELVRHKSRSRKFVFGIPAILTLQIIIAAYAVWRLL